MDLITGGIFSILAYKHSDKLIDAIQNGAGWLLKPIQQNRMAHATHQTLNLLENDISKYNGQVKIENGKIEFIAKAEASQLDIYQLSMIEKEVTKQINSFNIISKAAKILESKEEVSSDLVDKNWIFRYFEIAQDITDDMLQNLWADILAGEVAKPNSYSLRTLELLRNINISEANVFTKISSFIFSIGGMGFIPEKQGILENYGIEKDNKWLLEELNLVKSNMNYTFQKDVWISFLVSDYIVSVKANQVIKIYISILTQVGSEVFKLVKTNENYDVEKYILENFDERFEVKFGKVKKIHDDHIEHELLRKIR